MPFDKTTALTRLATLTPAQDAMVQPILDAAKALAETYCDRWFDEKDETEVIVPAHCRTLSMKRYPLKKVYSITGVHGEVNANTQAYDPAWVVAGTPAAPSASPSASGLQQTFQVVNFHMDKPAGTILIDGRMASHELTVNYHGGYATLPADLELALWTIFDAIWAAMPSAGAAVGSGGGGASDIERITIPDVGSISYRQSGSGGMAGSVRGAAGFIGDVAASILNMYRRESA